MTVHTIRLRAPWKRGRENDRNVWHRVFGCPSNLSTEETVRLVCHSELATGTAVLNGETLGSVPAGFEVTGKLGFRNRLVLRLDSSGEVEEGDREPPFDVSLEIHSG